MNLYLILSKKLIYLMITLIVNKVIFHTTVLYTISTYLKLSIGFQTFVLIALIVKISRGLNEKKCMVLTKCISLVKPLPLIISNCCISGTFPDIWKRTKIASIHKRGDRQLINNCRPVFSLAHT